MFAVTADANIYISGLHFGGVPLLFLNAARAGLIQLAVSDPLLAEVQRILRDKFHWPPDRLEDAAQRLAAFTQHVAPTQTLAVVTDDPDDNRILECAVAAGSHYIVTGDGDLMRLGNYNGIRILKVAEFLELAQITPRRA